MPRGRPCGMFHTEKTIFERKRFIMFYDLFDKQLNTQFIVGNLHRTAEADEVEQYSEQSKQKLRSPLRDWASPVNSNKKCIIFHNFKY